MDERLVDAEAAFLRCAAEFDNPFWNDGSAGNPWRDAFLMGAEAIRALRFAEPGNTSPVNVTRSSHGEEE